MTGERCAHIAVIGPTNAGKSTLVNAIIGRRVSMVSAKAQATRFSLQGIAQQGKTQLVFFDTPGFLSGRRPLDRYMAGQIDLAVMDADIRLLLFDSTSLAWRMRKGAPLLEKDGSARWNIDSEGLHRIIVFNKIDLLKKADLMPMIDKARTELTFDALFLLSALHKDGVEDVYRYLLDKAPQKPWFAPSPSEENQRLYASEITRESLYTYLHKEIPYHLHVTTEHMEKKQGRWRLHQVICIEKEKHKPLILGKRGAKIKAISMHARRLMEENFQAPVDLFLCVRKIKGGMTPDIQLRDWGYIATER